MTNKQFNFIEGLMRNKNYDMENNLISAFKSGYDLTVEEASNLIGYLLDCEDKKEESKMSKIFKEAHRLTRELKEKYPEINYQVQFSLFLSFLLNKENETKFRTGEKVKIYDDFGNGIIAEIADINILKDYRGITHVEYEIFLDEYGENVLFYEDEIEKIK